MEKMKTMKCPACKSNWNVPVEVSLKLKTCPFCGGDLGVDGDANTIDLEIDDSIPSVATDEDVYGVSKEFVETYVNGYVKTELEKLREITKDNIKSEIDNSLKANDSSDRLTKIERKLEALEAENKKLREIVDKLKNDKVSGYGVNGAAKASTTKPSNTGATNTGATKPNNDDGVYHKKFEKKENDQSIFSNANVEFGRYDSKPISWNVLDIEDNTVVLIASEVVDFKQFHNKKMRINWKDSRLCQYLNEIFYEMAFSIPEKKAIKLWNKGYSSIYYPNERVSILSDEEMKLYFSKKPGLRKHGYWIKNIYESKAMFATKDGHKYQDVNEIYGFRPAIKVDKQKLIDMGCLAI